MVRANELTVRDEWRRAGDDRGEGKVDIDGK